MIKIIITAFAGLALVINTCVIYYWRDTAFDPANSDLISYLVILPMLITALVLSPYFIFKAIQRYKAKKEEKLQQAADFEHRPAENISGEQKEKSTQSRQFALNIYSSAARHSFGENESILEQYKQFKSPELDADLLNAYGLPVLSLRIQDLDDAVEAEDDDSIQLSRRERRISQLIMHQLEQHADTLSAATEHLKNSDMFYDSEMAYQYRMHPAWTGEHRAEDDLEEDTGGMAEPISRLNKLCIHILLPESMIHHWNDESCARMQHLLAEQFSILPAQIEIKQHFVSHQTSYVEWLTLLEQIAQQEYVFNLIISADSEIDQDWLDEKYWQSEQYIAAEYASSWCIAGLNTEISGLMPQKTLKIMLDEASIESFLLRNQLQSHQQYQQDEPFMLILDDALNIKTSKQLQRKFANSLIEPHHFLYTHSSLGNTQQLAKIFSFMLGMHLAEELISMVFSIELYHAYSFFEAYQEEKTDKELLHSS